MPTKVYWYLPKHIIVNEHIGDISVQTLVKAVEVTLEMAKGLDDKFYLLADASKLSGAPKNIGEMSKLAQGLMENPNLEEIFVISANPLHKFLGNMVVQLLRKNAKVVSNVDEALAIIQRLDTSLPSLADIQPDLSQAVEII